MTFELSHHSAGVSLDLQAYAADHIALFSGTDREPALPQPGDHRTERTFSAQPELARDRQSLQTRGACRFVAGLRTARMMRVG